MSSREAAMNRFLTGVEKRAFGMARVAVKNTDDALDIVQNAMLLLVKKYASKPEEEWAPLFYRILQNGITDFHRSSMRRNKLFSFMSSFKDADGDTVDITELHAGRESDQPEQRSALDGAASHLTESLAALPQRQQQVFMLRTWEGLSVAQTAKAMKCSEGSVKTHYSRAVHRLRDLLGDHWS